VSRYGKRISGPLMDRIDLFVEVPRVDYEKLTGPSESESSSQVRQRTRAARELQRERFNGTQILDNSEMGPTEVYQYCQMDESAESLVQSAMQQMHLSARAYHRILKVSRTIADLGESETIGISHVAEALQYRPTQLL
jgi:magnesium chelatase family protein